MPCVGAHGQRAAAVFEEAAERLAAQARRLDDLAGDVRREIRDLHWTGKSADYFRRHAAYQAVRAEQNRDVVESLRVLVLRAAAEAATTKEPAAKKPVVHHSGGGISGGGAG